MNLKNQIPVTLREISKALDKVLYEEDDPGLLTGYCGNALFYAYYYRFTGRKKYLDKVYILIERLLGALSEKELTNAHSTGISGIAWSLQHLTTKGFIEQEEAEDIFKEVDELLHASMVSDLQEGYYDFMHQGLGNALYFCDRTPAAGTSSYLLEVVNLLEKTAEITGNGIRWQDQLTPVVETGTTQPVYNLGLSHGVPAIISILAKIHEKNLPFNNAAILASKAVDWLLSSANPEEEGLLSLFSRKVTAGGLPAGAKQSRLGWCYGDLGVALALWNAGRSFGNNTYQQEALRIFEHTIRLRTRENGNVHDACLCHGSMGISHIYRRIYLATGDPLFQAAAENWLQLTLQMPVKKQGPAAFQYRSESGFEKNFSLLNGISGIGLALVAAADNDTLPDWDRCLLIS
jgi:lantibiotic modifying enzyme